VVPDSGSLVLKVGRNLGWIDGDGSGLRQLTDCPEVGHPFSCNAGNPSFLPDGDWIVYDIDGADVRIVRIDGSGGRTIATCPAGSPPPPESPPSCTLKDAVGLLTASGSRS
jgi:hypothetical protein